MFGAIPFGDIKEAIELLERPMQYPNGKGCGMRHETINRNAPPTPVPGDRFGLTVLTMFNECHLSNKLGGCPHLLERVVDLLEEIRDQFFRNVELNAITQRILKWKDDCVMLDSRMRMACTGTQGGGIAAKYAPSVAQAAQDSKPILDEYHAILENPAFLADRAEAARILKALLLS
jgi:hypothetical protein